MIHQQTQRDQPVLVITICAASPPPGEPLSAFAQAQHSAWGQPADVIAVRQAEDRVAMSVLGADYLRLNLTDCIYRGRPEQGEWYYNNDDELFGPVHPLDLLLSTQIVAAVNELAPFDPQATLYAPLAVGRHVDHQLARAAAWQLRQQGWRVAFYEDYPYVDSALLTTLGKPEYHPLPAALAEMSAAQLQPQTNFFSEENLQPKIDSICAYASQVTSLFGNQANIFTFVRHYALHIGQGRPAERIWR
jgi:LmbE family N-acetylglucosaminyl deacetylase